MNPPERMLIEGRMRLREMLPAAREAVASDFVKMQDISTVFRAQLGSLTEDNLDAILVYPAPNGGWHCDLLLKDTPLGVPNSIGTPVAHPCATRIEAVKHGNALLCMVLSIARSKLEPGPPAFILHGWSVNLEPEFLATAQAAMPNGYPRSRVLAQIDKTLAALAPEGFDGDAYAMWPPENKARLLTYLHIAALLGIVRYPEPMPGVPPTHEGPRRPQ